MATRDNLQKLDAPTLVPAATVPYIIWGDEESGFVNDLFHVMSKEMVVVTVTMPPGAAFSSSDRFRPYFNTHECLYVLEGHYTCQDPNTGELRSIGKGEMLLMRELQWHYGHNFGDSELRLLEVICPPANAAELKDHPRPQSAVPFDAKALADWPRGRGSEQRRLEKIGQGERLNAILGKKNPVLLEVLASTEKVGFAVARLRPGARSDVVSFPYDVMYHVEEGHLFVSDLDGGAYFHAGAGDCVFLPGGARHRLFNHEAETCVFDLGTAGSLDRHTVEA
jgi:mannose-6-phosphate isomerase-like protein (cupin superfamily)